VGVATGAVAGLVAITPAAGYVSPLAAVLIGFAAALVCSYALQLKNRLRLDDSLDVLPVHGVAGLLGILLTGVFTLKSLNPAGADGLLVGQVGQLWIQLKAAGFTILFVGVGTYVILRLIRLVMPLRVKSRLVRRDVPLLLGVSMATWGMASGGRITWVAGLALITGTVINLLWEIRSAKEEPSEASDDMDTEGAAPPTIAAAKLAAGLGLLVLGSQVLVKGSIAAAQGLGVSETVIGLTIVAAGTSMPELVTSLVAAYRGKADLAIGNVVGSNLLNQLVILGLCGLVSGERGLGVDPVMLTRDFPIMVVTTLACLPIFWTGGVITRLEGWILIALYGVYVIEQILTSTASSVSDEFRLIVLIGVVPAVLVFFVWTVLRWKSKRHQLV
jgi:cation:H+ antiporter